MKKILLFSFLGLMQLLVSACGGNNNEGYPTRLTVDAEADTLLLPNKGVLHWRIHDKNDNGAGPDYTSGSESSESCVSYEWLKIKSTVSSPYDSLFISRNTSGKSRTLYLNATLAQYMLSSDEVNIKVTQLK